jgi:hypothetical protein
MPEGKVTGTIKQTLDDFGMTNLAAGTMIRQVGEDEEPIDLSDMKNVEAFINDMQTWSMNMVEEKNMSLCGYVSQKAQPYDAARVDLE